MTKEYKVELINIKEAEKKLNDLAQDGWEIAAYHSDKTNMVYFVMVRPRG